jgi:N-methylhydantoinase A/oxoprolinase/acetone carboxylase beta subunit
VNRVGADVGGTFTDLVYWSDEEKQVHVHKLPSSPSDPARALIDGIHELCELKGVEIGELDQLLHGTTVGTNIVLEKNGSDVGFITTEGFRDILYIGRHRRPYTFSIQLDIPWREPSLASRANRRVVSERIDAPSGDVLVPLDEDKVRQIVREFKEEGVDSITVGFLFSFLNPDHEQRAAAIVREEFPEAYLSVSHEVVPLHREYERFSTACLNSYIGPKTGRYLDRLRSALLEDAPELDVGLMTSSGGVVSVPDASQAPVSLLMSGPVAGIIGGIFIGQQTGHANVITLDVGGTSADIGVAPNGELRMRRLYDTSIGGYEVMLPMVDMDTIGAGGGSIAQIDAGGLLQVGPRSAGADPGPASYGKGGTEATATDAQVVLGRVRPEGFLGGRMQIDVEAARSVVDEHVTGRLGTGNDGRDEAAMAVVKILTHNMVRAIELNSVRKGFDPRDFSLVAFGGAGPLWAVEIARELAIPTVVVPSHPGVTSALGLLAADLKYEYSRTVMADATLVDPASLEEIFVELQQKAHDSLVQAGVAEDQMLLQRWADCRYMGQAYELLVPAPSGKFDKDALAQLEETFHESHEREYFHSFSKEKPVQIVHVRVYGIGLTPDLALEQIGVGSETPDSAAIQERAPVAFEVSGQTERVETVFYDGSRLLAGNVITGPAVIDHKDSTTVVPPGLRAEVDAYGNVIINCAEGQDG